MIQFVLVFGALVCGFNAYFSVSFSQGRVFDSYLRVNAELSGAILRVFGEDVTVSGKSISSPEFSLNIESGCDAIQASAFFVFAVLASPVSVARLARIRAVVLGTLLLLTLNLVRIVSLYYAGVFNPKMFDAMHAEVWQAGFIFLPIFFWLMWVHLVIRKEERQPDAST